MSHSELATIRSAFTSAVASGVSRDELERTFLGKQGSLTQVLRAIGSLPPEEKVTVSQEANQLRNEIREHLGSIQSSQRETVSIDTSIPGLAPKRGSIHPTSAIIYEMTQIFRELSFEVVEGPEIVTEEENFTFLNMGTDHPSRDGHETFYLQSPEHTVMRTQTTTIQAREIARRVKLGQMPIRIVMPGKTYRRESDATHSPMFHQMDAVLIDQQTTFSDLQGALAYFVRRLFGSQVETRFRPHNFPFTEPSAEMDIRWTGETKGSGKHTGWLEFGGCGMIHPAVLERAGLNPKVYQGWAFGMSVERPLMLRHQLPDLRRLYDNDPAILAQLSGPLC